jgi:hypothetical protein
MRERIAIEIAKKADFGYAAMIYQLTWQVKLEE